MHSYGEPITIINPSLNNCPVCHSDEVAIVRKVDDGVSWRVECLNCGLSTVEHHEAKLEARLDQVPYHMQRQITDAVEDWNSLCNPTNDEQDIDTLCNKTADAYVKASGTMELSEFYLKLIQAIHDKIASKESKE